MSPIPIQTSMFPPTHDNLIKKYTQNFKKKVPIYFVQLVLQESYLLWGKHYLFVHHPYLISKSFLGSFLFTT